MAQSGARKSPNFEVVSSIRSCRTFCHSITGWRGKGKKREPTESSTKDSLTTVLFRKAASTYKAPITLLMHHKGDSDNDAVGSA